MNPATSRSHILYFDRDLETMPRDRLRRHQARRLRKLLTTVLESNPFYRAKLRKAGIRKPVPLSHITDLPFTTKAELAADSLAHPPFGSNLSFPLAHYTRLHQTSGTTGAPLRWLDTRQGWDEFVNQWCFVYRGASVRAGQRVFVAFSFGPFSGFWSGFEAASRVGCLAITGGGQTSEQRVATIQATRPTVLVSTPTYALRLAEVAQSLGIDPSTLGIRVSIHAGEPGAGIPSTRQRIQDLWGCRTYDHCGLTEVGAVGYECHRQLGPHINEANFLLEIVDPESLQPVAAGQRGEIVLTSLNRPGSPLIRYRTGDLARIHPKPCSCRRTFALLRGGILGRSDDMLTIRGINVFPSAIENILRKFPEIVEFQGLASTLRGMPELTLQLECPAVKTTGRDHLAGRIIAAIHVGLNLRPLIEFVADGTLPRAEMKSRRFHVSSSVQ